jgi:hypothetical protein
MSQTLAKIERTIRAAIRAARKEGACEVEVETGDGATVKIPLVSDKPVAEPRPNSFDQVLGG